MGRGVAEGLAGVRGGGQLATVGVDDDGADRDVTGKRGRGGTLQRTPDERLVGRLPPRARTPASRDVDDLGERVGEPAAPADGRELLVRVQLDLGRQDLQLIGRQAEVGEDAEVALGPDVVERLVVRGQLDAQQVSTSAATS